MTLDALVDKCLKGDSSSQFELYRRYSKAMFNTALRIVGDRQEAEDVLQMAFVKVFRNLNSFRSDASLGSWIKRVVVNECISFLRKRKLLTTDLERAPIQLSPSVAPVEETSLRVDQIKQAVKELPDGYRVVFSLYLMEGYDHSEISDLLSISEATSKSQLSRAKDKVRKIIQSKYN